MEAEMHNQINQSQNQAVDIDHVTRQIHALYNSTDPAEQAEANRQLTALQTAAHSWDICWALLDLNRYPSVEVKFYAANTLVLKINQSWNQLDQDWLQNELRPKIFDTLVNYAGYPEASKLVIERLALALATFALHSIPTFWPDAIEDILKSFTPQNLHVKVEPQRICDILLKILMYIPEEYSVQMPQQAHRAQLNQQMTKSGENVFKFLHSLLVANENTVSSECRQSVLHCLTSWTVHSRTSLLEIDGGKQLLDLLYQLILDEDLCSQACASLAATFTSQNAENFRLSIIDFIPKIAQLNQAISMYLSKEELECAIKIYSLVINFSENHSRLFIKIILNDGIELAGEQSSTTKQAIFSIIKTILECTSAPGIYGLDEKYSDISFPFWFTFFENFYYYSDSYTDMICETFGPLVDSLLDILIAKSQYPSPISTYYHNWNDDQRESYRCYRQDLGDNISLIVSFPRSRDRILARLHERLNTELERMLQNGPTSSENSWQPFESIVFAIKSVVESVPFDEETHVPGIFAIISRVPYSESHLLLYCTVAEMISAYSDWLFSHPNYLAIALNILFPGISSPDSSVRLMSTLSLKDLTSECQNVLQPYAQQIVKACTDTLLQTESCLTTNEKARLMHTVGTTLATCSTDYIRSSLNSLAGPLINHLTMAVQQDQNNDANSRSVILDRLTMLNSLIESLYIRDNNLACDYDVDDENTTPYEQPNITMIEDSDIKRPSLDLLLQLLPILSMIANKYKADEELTSIIHNTIKRSTKSIGTEVKPAVRDILRLVVNAYDPVLNYGIIDAIVPLYRMFRIDESLHQMLMDSFSQISDKTIAVCLNSPLRQLSMTIEFYFKFSTIMLKKFPDCFGNPGSSTNVELIYKLAVASLELPEKRTIAEVCNFLIQFKFRSKFHKNLIDIFNSQLEIMLVNIFNIFGGVYSTPRNAMDHVTDLLFALADNGELRIPLKQIVERENFPTQYVNANQKANFVSSVLNERNRRLFKIACTEFVLKARNLNRAV